MNEQEQHRERAGCLRPAAGVVWGAAVYLLRLVLAAGIMGLTCVVAGGVAMVGTSPLSVWNFFWGLATVGLAFVISLSTWALPATVRAGRPMRNSLLTTADWGQKPTYGETSLGFVFPALTLSIAGCLFLPTPTNIGVALVGVTVLLGALATLLAGGRHVAMGGWMLLVLAAITCQG